MSDIGRILDLIKDCYCWSDLFNPNERMNKRIFDATVFELIGILVIYIGAMIFAMCMFGSPNNEPLEIITVTGYTEEEIERTRFHDSNEEAYKEAEGCLDRLIPKRENAFLLREAYKRGIIRLPKHISQ